MKVYVPSPGTSYQLSMKFFSGSNILSSKTHTNFSAPQPHEVASILSKRVHQANAQISVFKENTGAPNRGIFSRLYDLLLQDHRRSLRELRQRHNHKVAECNTQYQTELISLYKQMLQDINGLLGLISNSSLEGKIKDHFSRKGSCSSSGSSLDDEAPDNILDPITFTIFQDPVVTPLGVTYERSALLEYLEKNSNRDPLTKKPLSEEDLAPNLAVKAIVSDFLASREVTLKS